MGGALAVLYGNSFMGPLVCIGILFLNDKKDVKVTYCKRPEAGGWAWVRG